MYTHIYDRLNEGMFVWWTQFGCGLGSGFAVGKAVIHWSGEAALGEQARTDGQEKVTGDPRNSG